MRESQENDPLFGQQELTLLDLQRETIIREAIIEFTLTRNVKAYGLYSILNLIVLLLQKPVALVVFSESVVKSRQQNAESLGTLPWVHSLRSFSGLSDKCDEDIRKRLADPKQDFDWIIEIGDKSADEIKQQQCGITLGILYLDLRFTETETSQSANLRGAGARVDIQETKLRLLNPRDMNRVRRVFHSIASYSTSRQNGEMDFPQLRHLCRYWKQACGEVSLFPNVSAGIKEAQAGFDIGSLMPVLDPLIEEVDNFYMRIRGGRPGEFTEHPEELSSAPLLWARDREARENQQGRRPPTIAFYLHLKAPHSLDESGQELPEAGYRIVPIVTKGIALDLAATVLDYLQNSSASGRAKESEHEVRAYLEQLGVSDWSSRQLTNLEDLANGILEATAIENFVGRQAYHSFTYPAFASGISMFTPAFAASRCDRVAYGPDFLQEPRGRDVAFVKPTNVSGFCLVAFVTKTRADISWDTETSADISWDGSAGDAEQTGRAEFDTFYYNYMFQVGVIRRRLSSYIRSAMHRTYLIAVEEIVALHLDKARVRLTSKGGNEYMAHLNKNWLTETNRGLERICQALPFALTRLTEHDVSQADAQVNVFGREFGIELRANPFFGRKLIVANDRDYLKPEPVAKAIGRAIEDRARAWTGLEVSRNEKEKPKPTV